MQQCFRWLLLTAFSQLMLLLSLAQEEGMALTEEEFKSYLADELGMKVFHELWGEEAHCWHHEGYMLDTGKLNACKPTKLGSGSHGATWLVSSSFLDTDAHFHEEKPHAFALKVVNIHPSDDFHLSRHEFHYQIQQTNRVSPPISSQTLVRWDAIVTELIALRFIAPDDPGFTPAYMQCYTANRVYLVITRHRFTLKELSQLGVKLTSPELCTAAAQMSILVGDFRHVVPGSVAVHGGVATGKNWMVDNDGDIVLIDYGEALIYPFDHAEESEKEDNKAIIDDPFKVSEPMPLWKKSYYGMLDFYTMPSEYWDWISLDELFEYIGPKFEGSSSSVWEAGKSPHSAFIKAIRALKEPASSAAAETHHHPGLSPERNSTLLEELLAAPYFEQCFKSLEKGSHIDAEIKSRQEWLDELKKNKRKESRKGVLAPFLRVIREMDEIKDVAPPPPPPTR